MPAGQTYENIASVTLSSAQSSVTFSNIPQTYTDLLLIFRGNNNSGGNRAGTIRFNGDSGTNYSATFMQGDGASVASATETNSDTGYIANILNDDTNVIVQIMNYSNATTNKTFLARGNSSSTVVQARVALWRSTAAITSMVLGLNADSYASGCTFNLYGITAA